MHFKVVIVDIRLFSRKSRQIFHLLTVTDQFQNCNDMLIIRKGFASRMTARYFHFRFVDRSIDWLIDDPLMIETGVSMGNEETIESFDVIEHVRSPHLVLFSRCPLCACTNDRRWMAMDQQRFHNDRSAHHWIWEFYPNDRGNDHDAVEHMSTGDRSTSSSRTQKWYSGSFAGRDLRKIRCIGRAFISTHPNRRQIRRFTVSATELANLWKSPNTFNRLDAHVQWAIQSQDTERRSEPNELASATRMPWSVQRSTKRSCLAAVGPASILSLNTNWNQPQQFGQVYWYRTAGKSFGFAPSGTIRQTTADNEDLTNAQRLSWLLDQNIGGYRVGALRSLQDNALWRKIIYCNWHCHDRVKKNIEYPIINQCRFHCLSKINLE